jgi:protein JSN1
MPNGQTVRIGFGKADSAPAAPGKGPGGSSSNGSSSSIAGKNSASPSISGMEAQLQSTPTRALWIGSIPSTTTPATILSVFSPYGPIESARVLTHKNCGFINFERLDDAVRARKALNGRDVLGSDVGAIRIGFAKVPVKNGQDGVPGQEEAPSLNVQGVGDLSVGATIHALRSVKGASTIPVDQQVLGGTVENYRSNLLLSMIGTGTHNTAFVNDGTPKPAGWCPTVTEQQMIMKELLGGAPDADADVLALAGIESSLCGTLLFAKVTLQTSVRQRCITPPFLWYQSDRITGAGMPQSCGSCAREWTRTPLQMKKLNRSLLISLMVRSSTLLLTG